MSYLIRVNGDLDASWLDYYRDISILVSEFPDAPSISTICLRNADQATLLGILNALYNYQFPIVYLEQASSLEAVPCVGMEGGATVEAKPETRFQSAQESVSQKYATTS